MSIDVVMTALVTALDRMIAKADREERAVENILARDDIQDEEHEAFYAHGYATALRNVRSMLQTKVEVMPP